VSTDDARDDDDLSRRAFAKLGLTGALVLLAGCPDAQRPLPLDVTCEDADDEGFDYVIVGSGAGGGPLACNLARRGFRVLLLEAGGDEPAWYNPIPLMHIHTTEDPAIRWDFWVRHYADEAQQRRDFKHRPSRGGVLYPRASAVGGCTAHHALISLCAHPGDWDDIAATTGDPGWRDEAMRPLFERLERCRYAPRASSSHNPGRHGFSGWLHLDTPDPALIGADPVLRRIVAAAIDEAGTLDPQLFRNAVRMVLDDRRAIWDPNDWRTVREAAEGMFFVPLQVNSGTRHGPREYIHATLAACPSNFVLRTHSLATEVLFSGRRAVGVAYLEGEGLYRAGVGPGDGGVRREVLAKREVILAGGTFNTPQLLMLSGIGPRDELERLGIPVRVDRPGVGRNLQDRYEISVVTELESPLALLDGADVAHPDRESPDPHLARWLAERRGFYATNGVLSALVKRSRRGVPAPDLFIFGAPGDFRGYYPGWPVDLSKRHDLFTWAVLKGHTHRDHGRVKLRTTDPRDTPDIDFAYFGDGGANDDADVAALVEGIRTARRVMKRVRDVVHREVFPGRKITSDAALAEYVRDNTWGHHACGTCRMGRADDPLAVVDSRLRVLGVDGLRVVDASVFPRIPGFFIAVPIYMVAEKASDLITEDARNGVSSTG